MAQRIVTDAQGNVIRVETVPDPDPSKVVPKGPTPQQAARRNAPQQQDPAERERRAKELRDRRSATIMEVLARRRALRQAELDADLARTRVEAGKLDDAVKTVKIKASEVIVPPEYQRPFNEKRAQQYARRFRWEFFGTVSVNRRPDGILALVDGQHRLRAAQMLFGPDVEVPAQLTAIKTTTGEAKGFGAINAERSAPTYNALFRTRFHSEDPDALQVCLVLHEVGLRPLWPGERRGVRGAVTAMRTVEYMIQQAGISSARAVFAILHDVGKDEPEWYRDFILAGMWQLLVRFDGYAKPDRLVYVLSRLGEGYHELSRLAQRNRTGVNGSVSTACCAALHALYNHNLRVSDSLPPFSIEVPRRQQNMIKRAAERWRAKHEDGKGPGPRTTWTRNDPGRPRAPR